MGKINKIFYTTLALALFINGASAIGISSASFGDVELERSYTQTVTLLNSENDFDNHFVIEIDGTIKDWITVSPSEFDLTKGNTKQITLTLEVPEDAPLGEITGTVTAVGKNTVPSSDGGSGGANVGYAIATKGNIYANVVKQGALASVEIIGVDSPSNVATGDVARITVTSRNNGNVATTASFKLEIKNNGKVVATVPGTPTDFALNEEKTVKLFWDTQGMQDDKYELNVQATTIAKGSEKTTSTSYEPLTIQIGETGSSSLTVIVIGAGILIIILGIILKRKK